jgi:hypothetical protein
MPDRNIVTAGATMTGVGTVTALPAQGLIGSATNRIGLLEISVTNTTSTACIWRLCRITTAGTAGASLTSYLHDIADGAATGIVKQAWTVAPTIADLGYRLRIPATVGAGVIRTFENLTIPATASNGIGLVIDAGTGQLCDVDWTWCEL